MRKLLAIAAVATLVGGSTLGGSTLGGTARAAVPLIDWSTMWHSEDGWANGVSQAGYSFVAFGVANAFGGPLAGLPFAGHEYTVVILGPGPTSAGSVATCGGPLCAYHTNYAGGTLLLIDDVGPATPATACTSSSYTNGTYLLVATVNNLFENTSNFSTVGNFESDLTWTGGSLIGLVSNPGTALLTGGSDRRPSVLPGCPPANHIVELLDGKIDLNPPLPTLPTTWSGVKSLYR